MDLKDNGGVPLAEQGEHAEPILGDGEMGIPVLIPPLPMVP